MTESSDADLERRISNLPTPHMGGPDTASYRARASQRRTRKRIASSAAAIAVLCGGVAVGATQFNSSAPVTIEAAGEPIDDTTEPTTNSSLPESTLLSSEPSPPATDPASSDQPATSTTMAPSPPMAIGPGEISDGLGGKLFVLDGRIVHLHPDETLSPIFIPRQDGTAPSQTWLTDIALLDGTPHLFISTFVVFDFEQSIFETTIEMVNLQTDELSVVERRRIEGTENDNWIYNGHITSDGSNLRVVRELWQGQCYFTETLRPDGALVPADEPFPKPRWLDGITEELATEL